jgi:hypothetical protein
MSRKRNSTIHISLSVPPVGLPEVLQRDPLHHFFLSLLLCLRGFLESVCAVHPPPHSGVEAHLFLSLSLLAFTLIADWCFRCCCSFCVCKCVCVVASLLPRLCLSCFGAADGHRCPPVEEASLSSVGSCHPGLCWLVAPSHGERAQWC